MRQTKNVFLDSSAIIGQNINFASPALKRIEELATEGEAILLTSTIVVREVEASIRQRIREAAVAVNRIKNKYPVVKNLPAESVQAILQPFDTASAERYLIAQYQDFRARTFTVTVPVKLASVDDVLEAYFSASPPFSEAKKHEFPDAINLSALVEWCTENKEKAYVVSSDPDLVNYCKQSSWLISLSRPGEYVDAFSRESATLRLVEVTTQENVDKLEEAIVTEFEQSGFYLDDMEGEVHDVEVLSVEIEDLSLLQLEGNIARFEITGSVDFAADISYDDTRTGMWDSEDGVMIGMQTIQTKVERTESFSLIAEIVVGEDGRFSSVKRVVFSKSDFGFAAIEDGYPYK